jgi:Uma2 family endonuclease
MSEAFQERYDGVTIAAFRAFVDERPDGEKWELIDGEVLLNPAPNSRHQRIVRNLLFLLESARRSTNSRWDAIPGVGVTNPRDDHNQPEPDVMVTSTIIETTSWTSDVLVAFEVLSPFSKRRDMVQKRAFYTALPGLSHYVVLAQDRMEATVFARSEGFASRKLTGGAVELASLGVSLNLADLYRDVPEE